MRRYLLPTLFAWLTLLVSLHYIAALGWNDTSRERHWDWYWGYADNLARHGKYQDCTPEPDSYHCAEQLPIRAYRLPGYPLFLAGVILIAGDNAPATAKLLQAVLMAQVVFMVVHLSYRLRPSHALATLTGLLLLTTRLLYWVPVAFTEILFTLVLMLFVHGFLARHWQLAGVLWGGSLLIRSSFVFATPFLLLQMPRRAAARFGAIVVLVLVPYTVRNLVVLHTFAPLGTNGGNNVRVGHNPVMYAKGQYTDLDRLPDWSAYAQLGEVDQDKALRRAGWRYATAHLAELPRATARKVLAVMGLEAWLPLGVWSLVGVLKWRRRHGR